MRNEIFLLLLVVLIGISINYAHSQEVSLATFQETAQIIVDKSISHNATASITLQSTSIQEIKIPAELEQKIREDKRLKSIVVTNQNQCVIGVVDESCILINVVLNPDQEGGIFAIQDSTKEIGNSYIDEINQAFDTNAEFHSVFIHTNEESNIALDTSGAVSGRGIVSAIYTMPMEDTGSMYEKISAMLIPKIIREGGGFFDVAKNLSYEEKSKMTFSLIPLDTSSLLQLKLSIDYPNVDQEMFEISPLEFLKVDNIKRSDYFSTGFYPLNSLIQIVILSPESTNVSDVKGNIVPTQIIGNEKIPTEISEAGWIFDPEEGQRIQGKYIFGEKESVSKKELEFSLGGTQLQAEKIEFDESIMVVIIISIVAIAAALFYLKGYKK